MNDATRYVLHQFECYMCPLHLWYVTYTGDRVNHYVEHAPEFRNSTHFRHVASNLLAGRLDNPPFTSAFADPTAAVKWVKTYLPHKTQFTISHIRTSHLHVFDVNQLIHVWDIDTSDARDSAMAIPFWVLGQIPNMNHITTSVCELDSPFSPIRILRVNYPMDVTTRRIVHKHDLYGDDGQPEWLYRVQYGDNTLDARATWRVAPDYGDNTVSEHKSNPDVDEMTLSTPIWFTDEDDFADTVRDHLNWKPSLVSPFVSTFSNRSHAENWARKRDSSCTIYKIDVAKLRHVFRVKHLVEWLDIRLPHNVTSRMYEDEYLVLATIPPESVVGWERVSKQAPRVQSNPREYCTSVYVDGGVLRCLATGEAITKPNRTVVEHAGLAIVRETGNSGGRR